jgi:hypothetical protein
MLRDSVATKAPKAIPVAASQVLWDHNYLNANPNQSELGSQQNEKRIFKLQQNPLNWSQNNVRGLMSEHLSPNANGFKTKVPNTGRLQPARDDDGAASHGVANMFLDDYS